MPETPRKPAKNAAPKTPAPTYAELQGELDRVLIELQREDLDVDEALRYYQEGMELVQQLEQYLKTAQNKITELTAKAGPAPA